MAAMIIAIVGFSTVIALSVALTLREARLHRLLDERVRRHPGDMGFDAWGDIAMVMSVAEESAAGFGRAMVLSSGSCRLSEEHAGCIAPVTVRAC